MIYHQLSGLLTTDEGNKIGKGYAGHGEGKNNPSMERIHDIGPLPKGTYYIGKVIDSPHTGPFTIILIPDKDNKMYGRGDFRMHGDSIKEPGTASNGCIIMPRSVREKVYEGEDKIIEVV